MPDTVPPGSSLTEQIKRLQAESRGLAREHVKALEDALAEIRQMAAEIAAGGEAYPVGVREVARGLAQDARSRIETLAAIRLRN